MNDILVTGGVGVFSTIVTNIITFLLTRRRYNSEVKHPDIQNMKESLEFYKSLSDDNKRRLDDILEENKIIREQNDRLEQSIEDLKKRLSTISDQICVRPYCEQRQRFLMGNKQK